MEMVESCKENLIIHIAWTLTMRETSMYRIKIITESRNFLGRVTLQPHLEMKALVTVSSLIFMVSQ
jgi:hypothetical protein